MIRLIDSGVTIHGGKPVIAGAYDSGAKEKTILAQFVTEAATTSALGGALGIVLGYIVSMAANRVLPMFTDGMDITVSPSFDSIVVAFGISAGIGVLFGYLPAKRAAKLNPIDALRYD